MLVWAHCGSHSLSHLISMRTYHRYAKKQISQHIREQIGKQLQLGSKCTLIFYLKEHQTQFLSRCTREWNVYNDISFTLAPRKILTVDALFFIRYINALGHLLKSFDERFADKVKWPSTNYDSWSVCWLLTLQNVKTLNLMAARWITYQQWQMENSLTARKLWNVWFFVMLSLYNFLGNETLFGKHKFLLQLLYRIFLLLLIICQLFFTSTVVNYILYLANCFLFANVFLAGKVKY